jgi:hypothetical protein
MSTNNLAKNQNAVGARVEEGWVDMINAHCMHAWKYYTESHKYVQLIWLIKCK